MYLYIRLYIDVFKRYKTLTEKVFNGLILSYQTKEFGIKEFNDFFFTEAIIHIRPSILQEMLNGIEELKSNSICVENMIQKLDNFTSSFFEEGLFNDPFESSLLKEYLINYGFRDAYTNIFSNLFTILGKLDIKKDKFNSSKKSLIKFLKIESELAWYDIKEFSVFIYKKGFLFDFEELLEILKLSINKDMNCINKFEEIIKVVPSVIVKLYPNKKIENIKLIQTAILKCSSENSNNSDFYKLIPLVNICNEKCKALLIETFESHLDENFNGELYHDLIELTDYNYDSKNYFQKYCEYIHQNRRGETIKYGKLKLTDYLIIQLAFILYKNNIDFNRNELNTITTLNEFEKWLLNPYNFNYDKFDAEWLIDLNFPVILLKLQSIDAIYKSIDLKLNYHFDSNLALIKYKYFNKFN